MNIWNFRVNSISLLSDSVGVKLFVLIRSKKKKNLKTSAKVRVFCSEKYFFFFFSNLGSNDRCDEISAK